MAKTITYARRFNGNEYERQGKNGRIYYGVVGWRYVVQVNGEYVDDFATLSEAKRKFPGGKRISDK